MRIAVLQSPGRGPRVHDNLGLLEARAAEAAAAGARLLVTPEMFLAGYNVPPEALAQSALACAPQPLAPLADVARRHDLALVVGYPERDGERIYNAAVLLDRHGQVLLNHRKSHLFGALDRRAFSAGAGEARTVELEGMRLGLLICYDVEFPENARALALAGADVIVVPTALMQPYAFVARTLVPARAYENQVFLAYANRCGRELELHYQGLSCVVAPDGRELARAADGETLLLADLDPQLQAASRRLNTYLADRRPSLYTPLLDGEGP